MNEIGEKFLPVGTVVMLKGGSKRVMIAGFCAMSEEAGEKIYDYSGCLYPEGFISSTQTCLFDHEQIEKVYFKGFVDEEEIEFKKKLDVLIKQINGGVVPTSQNVTAEEMVENNDAGVIDDLDDDDFIKNFPGPIEDAIKAVNESEEVVSNIDDDDEFLKNFPGPIEDAIKAVKESTEEPDIIEEVIELDDTSNDSETPKTNIDLTSIEF